MSKNSKKLVLLLVAVMLIIGCAIGGTLAWLIAETDPVVNTFTAGDINITLTEPNYDKDNNKLIPGGTISKDPTVTVLKGSEDCYVRMYMIIHWSEAADGWFKNNEADDWFNFQSGWIPGSDKYMDDVTGKTLVNIYEFRYNGVVTTSEDKDTVLPALFDTITVPDTLTGEKYASLEESQVEIVAQAVQSAGFANNEEAFASAGRPTYVTELINKYYPASNPETP